MSGARRHRGPRSLAASGLLAVAFALAAGPLAAGADARVTLVAPGGGALPGQYQGWADASFVPTVDRRLVLHLAGCPRAPRLAGCVDLRKLDALYLNPRLPFQQSTLLHELGHIFDFTTLRASDRRAFARASGRRAGSWYAGRNPLFEQFAEGYSFCARFRTIARSVRPFATYRYDVGPREHARVCAVIRRAAAHGPRSRPDRPPPGVVDPEPVRPTPPAGGPQGPGDSGGSGPGPSGGEQGAGSPDASGTPTPVPVPALPPAPVPVPVPPPAPTLG